MKLRAALFLVAFWAATASGLAQLTSADVTRVINQAVMRAVRISPNSVIAVTDREGYVLGVWVVRGGAATPGEIATAVSKAGTAAYLSSNQNAFTSRTAGFIIQQHFPPGIRNITDAVLASVMKLASGGNVTDVVLAAARQQHRDGALGWRWSFEYFHIGRQSLQEDRFDSVPSGGAACHAIAGDAWITHRVYIARWVARRCPSL